MAILSRRDPAGSLFLFEIRENLRELRGNSPKSLATRNARVRSLDKTRVRSLEIKKEDHGEKRAVAFYVLAAALTQPVSGIRSAAPFGYHYNSRDHLLPLKPLRIGPVPAGPIEL